MDQIRIKVDTAVLAERASTAEEKIKAVRNRFGKIEEIVRGSRNYWEGEAGEAHRREYGEYREEIEETLARFQENVNDLRRIANIYDEAQAEALNLSQDLPVDVII